MMHSCYCIWFILRCGFSFVWFEFKIHFKMVLETNLSEKRKEREKGNLTCGPVAWRPVRAEPSRPALFPSRWWAVEAELLAALLPAQRGPAQGATVAARFPPFLCFADAGARCQPCLLPLAVAEPETDVASNRINRESQDFLTEHGILGL
jgi:hypothetical protein